MNYQLSIRDHNLKPHLDLEEEVKSRQSGILTFTIRVNNGNIVDLNITEYVNAKRKYGIVTGILIEEYTVTHDSGERSKTNTVGNNNIHGGDIKGNSSSGVSEHSETKKT